MVAHTTKHADLSPDSTSARKSPLRGLIFDIKKFAIHDGPGIRTTVFMKGCPLRCEWCHNPESIKPAPEIAFFESKCISCGRCFEVCPTGALWQRGEERGYDRTKCTTCGKCVKACYAQARVMEGTWMTIQEVMDELEKDRVFYENSGGGITISGGEPLMQKDFVGELLKTCKTAGFHTALDTSGYGCWTDLKDLLACTDLVLMDIKTLDRMRHKRFTGVGTHLILANINKLCSENVPVILRIPVVPGFNDSLKNVRATARLARDMPNVQHVELLPYHRLGEAKYERLGKQYIRKDLRAPAAKKLGALVKAFIDAGIEARIE